MSSQVAMYINKRQEYAQICVLSHIIQHDNIVAMPISPKEGNPLIFLNVYNVLVVDNPLLTNDHKA